MLRPSPNHGKHRLPNDDYDISPNNISLAETYKSRCGYLLYLHMFAINSSMLSPIATTPRNCSGGQKTGKLTAIVKPVTTIYTFTHWQIVGY